jgi:hypothetical protein
MGPKIIVPGQLWKYTLTSAQGEITLFLFLNHILSDT